MLNSAQGTIKGKGRGLEVMVVKSKRFMNIMDFDLRGVLPHSCLLASTFKNSLKKSLELTRNLPLDDTTPGSIQELKKIH
jgi:hypothetical protein